MMLKKELNTSIVYIKYQLSKIKYINNYKLQNRIC